jgi:hypothetical protein
MVTVHTELKTSTYRTAMPNILRDQTIKSVREFPVENRSRATRHQSADWCGKWGGAVGSTIIVALVFYLSACGGSNKAIEADDASTNGSDRKSPNTTQSGSANDTTNPVSQTGSAQTASANCTAVGKACKTASQCCFGRCEQDICLGPTGVCSAAGVSCVASAECCSGRCEALSGTDRVCSANACVAVGKACTLAIECCSLTCTNGTCSDGEGCAMIGQSCDAKSDCCSNLCTDDKCQKIPGTLCAGSGEQCAADAACCSGKCQEMGGVRRCAVVSTCRAGGEPCSTNGDCCSGTCGQDGFCPLMSMCQTAGEPCTGFRECCSGLCADPGTGVRICQYMSGCRPVGEVCAVDEDCCGLRCLPYGTTGINRCTKPAGCMYPGEVCWTGQSANCCPPGATGGNRLCEPTILGVRRCFSSGTDTECLPDGKPCAFADECCSKLCLPNAAGELTCGPNCVPILGSCRADADCCEGRCVDGSCKPNDLGCVPLGGHCDKPEDCCADFCDTATHSCAVVIE